MTDALYASVLRLDRRAIRKLAITDPYSLHRVVYSLFDDTRTEAEKRGHDPSGIVFADKGGNRLGRTILTLSDRAAAQGVIRDGEAFGEVESRPIPEDFLRHPRYRFEVVVNPTVTSAGKRVPIKGRDAIEKWFVERSAENWGFSAPAQSLQVGQVNVQQFKGKHGNHITLSQAQLTGLLEVTDEARFRESFARGIGRGRAFGCGLLQIRPVIDNPFGS